MSTGTYDSQAAKEASLDRIISIFIDLGAKRIFTKQLAPNDNSKNQPYFGPHLTDLSIIPTGDTVASETTSRKPNTKKRKNSIKYQASLNLNWIDTEGNVFHAPHAKLIYYPQYPEVRFSGFMKGSQADVSEWMDPYKKGRSLGRWLILGVTDSGAIFAYLAVPDSSVSNELGETNLPAITSVFSEIKTNAKPKGSTKEQLLETLKAIHNLGWIQGQKLDRQGNKLPYIAQNAGGYTLEAELGVSPNGVAEPDFLGWEIKQFGVTRFPAIGTKPTTLMTPEPNGGIYIDEGTPEFIRRFGYPDKNGIEDRLNFGGRHIAGVLCSATNLTLTIVGFNSETSEIIDANGQIALIAKNGEVAASWSFPKLLDHWKKKHSQAAYIPSIKQKTYDGVEYCYGQNIELGEGTSFTKLLLAVSKGCVYYDPGIKLEGSSTTAPKVKKRSQFRIKHNDLGSLYTNYEFIDVLHI